MAADDNIKRERDDEEESPPPPKKVKKVFSHKEIPATAHYHRSWMHADLLTAVVSSSKHGYVITGSADGVVKFWKRQPVVLEEAAPDTKTKEVSQPCLEFVKSFTAHDGPVQALAIDGWQGSGDTCCSVGVDGLLKWYDIGTFDVLTMIASGQALGTSVCSLHDPTTSTSAWAVSDRNSGSIYIYSQNTASLLQTLTLHGANRITTLARLSNSCVLSTDEKGIVEVWSTISDAAEEGRLNVGGAPGSRNKVTYSSKMDTDLYALVRKKTSALAAAATLTQFALYCADDKIRVYNQATGKLAVTFDERLGTVYDQSFSNAPYNLDSIEYGRRAAIEREMKQESTVFSSGYSDRRLPPQRLSIAFDASGKYLILPTLMGIKVIDWQKHKLAAIVGTADTIQLRFIGVCLTGSDAKVNRQIQLARASSTRTSAGAAEDSEKGKPSDALLVAIAYNKRRLFVFSHIDPVEMDDEGTEDVLARRDVWNETPWVQDQMYTQRAAADSSKSTSKAILRTTMGDIHIQLFGSQVPKTIENFLVHSKSGYYDNVIFHRVIKGFMLQTGDPLGDGTGGESIWGGEFEDEFVPGLRHDRPFTVSMANAGPNTNGSQFYITTVPTNWLDNKHTVFGRVVQGMDVCTMIENVETDDNDKPLKEIRILNVDLE